MSASCPAWTSATCTPAPWGRTRGRRCSRGCTFHSHFSHIEFTPGGGEKCHRTFADDGGYGPDWAPLAQAVAARGWSPTFICESAGTQAEDALTMKRIYQELEGKGQR